MSRVMLSTCLLVPLGLISAVLVFGADPPAPRAPVPPAAAQDTAAELVREVFKADLAAAKTPSQKAALAGKLVQSAGDTKDDPTGKYVLLREARDLAIDAGEIDIAMKAIDLAATDFAIDSLAVKSETLGKAGVSARLTAVNKAVASKALELSDEALAADRMEVAEKLVVLALGAARKATDGPIVKSATARVAHIQALKVEREAVSAAMATLEKSPTDPAANLAVGRYLCFSKGDWEKGLPMLAIGPEEGLRELAKLEIGGPTTVEERMKVADGWWATGDKMGPGPGKDAVVQHASEWYRKLVTETSGLTKAKIESRLASVPNVPRPVGRTGADSRVDVLKKLDAAKLPKGWTLANGSLRCEQPSGEARHDLTRPQTNAYEFLATFTPVSGSTAGATFVFPVGNERFINLMLVNRDRRLYKIDGKDLNISSTIEAGRTYKLRMKVELDGDRARVLALLDGRVAADWSGQLSKLRTAIPDDTPGVVKVRIYESVTVFTNVEVTVPDPLAGKEAPR